MASSRTRKNAFLRTVDHAAVPAYLVSADMKIRYCNQAVCDWTSQTEEFLSELKCHYSSPADAPLSDRLARGLCPPPTAFEGNVGTGMVSVEVEGQVEFREATFVPLPPVSAGDSDSCDVLVLVIGNPRSSSLKTEGSDHGPLALHHAIRQMQYQSKHRLNLEMLVGTSPASQRVRRQIDVATDSDANLVLVGPTGSGRRLLAELIHFAKGPELCGPLIPIDGRLCDAEIVQTTIKDLYRHAREYPDEPLGRLLLKNIDHMPVTAQLELLGFIELPEFELPIVATASRWPIADPNSIGADDNVLQRLDTHVSTLVIRLPSLAERNEDVPYLAQAILEKSNRASQARQFGGFTDDALELLRSYHWPGELAELIRTIETAAQTASSALIEIEDLPRHLSLAVKSQQTTSAGFVPVDLDGVLSDVENELVHRALEISEGNRSRAAKLLNISRARLLRRLREPLADDGDEAKDEH